MSINTFEYETKIKKTIEFVLKKPNEHFAIPNIY